jgi:hypothetical protein
VKVGVQRSWYGPAESLAGWRGLPVGKVFTKFLVLLPTINQRTDSSTILVLPQVICQVGLSFWTLEKSGGP